MRAVVLVLALAGCDLLIDDRVAPPITGQPIANAEPIPASCRSTVPLVDIDPLDHDPSVWHGFALGAYLRSDDGGASWTKVRGVQAQRMDDQLGTFGTEYVVDSDTWLAVRGGNPPVITRDGGEVFADLDVEDQGQGPSLPLGIADQWAEVDPGLTIGRAGGLWFAPDQAGGWEVIGAQAYGRFNRFVARDGLRRVFWDSDEGASGMYLVEADGTEVDLHPSPLLGEDEALSPFFTDFLDADHLWSVTGYLRVQSLVDGSARVQAINGGVFQPNSVIPMPEGDYLTLGAQIVGSESTAKAYRVDPTTLSVREVYLDVGTTRLPEPQLRGTPIDHGDGTLTVVVENRKPVPGVRRSMLCRIGAGVEPGLTRIVEGVPPDLAPGEVVIHALRDEELLDDGRFALGEADLPVWTYRGLPYQAAPPAPFADVDGAGLPPAIDLQAARFVTAGGGGQYYAYHDSPQGSVLRSIRRDQPGAWEGLFDGELYLREGHFGGKWSLVESVGDRRWVQGTGIDGLWLDDGSPGTLGVDRFLLWVDGLSGRYPVRDEDWLPCETQPPSAGCVAIGDRLVGPFGTDSADDIYLADNWHGAVWVHRDGAAGDEWERVAEGFTHVSDLEVRERNGRTVVYVLDRVLYAFTPEPGVVARWSAP